jgi:hypothetical protein
LVRVSGGDAGGFAETGAGQNRMGVHAYNTYIISSRDNGDLKKFGIEYQDSSLAEYLRANLHY